MYKHCCKLILLVFFFTGCAVTPQRETANRVNQLALELQMLESNVTREEAMFLSRDIFNKTAQLTQEFDLTSPPWFHNFLVNTGFRKKGLCYHWSDALYLYFSKKEYDAFAFHLAGAHIGEYFSEHNVLVITGRHGKFEEGIVIDPWRNSGKLYFCKLKEDKKYLWRHRRSRGCK